MVKFVKIKEKVNVIKILKLFRTMFTMRDGANISVADFFHDNYKIRLECGILAVEKRPQGMAFYPLDVLEVPRGQRVLHSKTTPQLVGWGD